MDSEAAFVTRLIGFGLSEKEAQLYLHLLKYGPKTPSPLAKSLKTYREDVHRTLTSLIEKGMVRPSLVRQQSMPRWTSTPRLTLQ
ncbi:MAG: helix-turn-helix domain-containing protein [Halobacteriota archaeon]|jgi:sugar-specific transcriptional regulator TrmB